MSIDCSTTWILTVNHWEGWFVHSTKHVRMLSIIWRCIRYKYYRRIAVSKHRLKIQRWRRYPVHEHALKSYHRPRQPNAGYYSGIYRTIHSQLFNTIKIIGTAALGYCQSLETNKLVLTVIAFEKVTAEGSFSTGGGYVRAPGIPAFQKKSILLTFGSIWGTLVTYRTVV